MEQILRGVVGSTAYGLATPESDIDRLSIHVEPTERLVQLSPETKFSHQFCSPTDLTSHEVGKACSLMFGGNPTVTEILWLSDYELCTKWGEWLIELRSDFLSAPRARDAYLGYAHQQVARFIDRGRFRGSMDTRRNKHMRHVLRLIEQGLHLYRTGEVKLLVDDPEGLRERADEIAESCELGVADAQRLLHEAKTEMLNIKTPLPEQPRYDRVGELIGEIRKVFYAERVA